MDLLEELGAVRAIQETKARYFRFMDTRDFAAMETLFTADAHVDVSVSGVVLEPGSKEDPYQHPARMEGGVFDDRTAFLTFLQSLLTGVRSVHQGHMSEISFLSPDRAKVVWAFEDFLDFPEGAQLEGKPIHVVHGHGHYWEEYQRTDNGWRIASMKITRLREVRH